MVAPAVFMVVAEDGSALRLTGTPDQSRNGATLFLRLRGSSGYLASRVGDRLNMLEALNEPTVPFGDVEKLFLQHSGRRGSNQIFKQRRI